MKMSKMKMPEMSVVRFTESDVICSSTYIPLTMTIAHWNDGIITNGNVTFKEGDVTTTYSYQNRNIGDTFLFHSPYADYQIEVAGGGTTTFGMLTRHEGTNPYEGTNGPLDGSYTWNSQTHVFDYVKQ